MLIYMFSFSIRYRIYFQLSIHRMMFIFESPWLPSPWVTNEAYWSHGSTDVSLSAIWIIGKTVQPDGFSLVNFPFFQIFFEILKGNAVVCNVGVVGCIVQTICLQFPITFLYSFHHHYHSHGLTGCRFRSFVCMVAPWKKRIGNDEWLGLVAQAGAIKMSFRTYNSLR